MTADTKKRGCREVSRAKEDLRPGSSDPAALPWGQDVNQL